MKTKINFLAFVLSLTLTVAFLLPGKKASAILPEGEAKQKAVICNIFENGVEVMRGTVCETGTNTCKSNPCH